jgi:hypothetical protein
MIDYSHSKHIKHVPFMNILGTVVQMTPVKTTARVLTKLVL